MKTVIFEVEPWEAETFSGLDQDHDVTCVPEPLTVENVEQFADAQVVSTFIYSSLSQDVLDQLPNLKFIATRSTGFDHIDATYCKEQGLLVSNVPSYGENTVAEHTFGLLLNISHRLTEAVDRTRRGDFSPNGLQGFDLRGKTLGVVGTGTIGQYVIGIARGFQMEVVAFDVTPKPELAEQLGFRYASLDEVLATADIVTLHVPANPKTHHLIAKAQFDQMKDGVVLINTSRGPIVDEDALLTALQNKDIGGAGIDVYGEEPLPADHPIRKLDNVLLTPHIGYVTAENLAKMYQDAAEDIAAFLDGNPVRVLN